MSESPTKKENHGKEEISSPQGPSTSSPQSPASPESEPVPYDNFLENVITQTLTAMKPSSVDFEKQLEDNIIVVNMERPCCCGIRAEISGRRIRRSCAATEGKRTNLVEHDNNEMEQQDVRETEAREEAEVEDGGDEGQEKR
jgi:hypothetical protein